MEKSSNPVFSEDTLVSELYRNAKTCLEPYIEQTEYGQEHSDPASAFFDFIVQAIQQIGTAFDDSCLLECMSDAFTMLDSDLTGSGYQLDTNVVDVDMVPRINIRLMKVEALDDDPLMRMSLDMPQIRTIIAKRARY